MRMLLGRAFAGQREPQAAGAQYSMAEGKCNSEAQRAEVEAARLQLLSV